MWLNFPNPTAITDGKKVDAKKVKQAIYKARQDEIQSTASEERWQGKLIKNRWDDEKVKLEEFFAWLPSWKNAPTHTIAGVQELYQQLLPTVLLAASRQGFKRGVNRGQQIRRSVLIFSKIRQSADIFTKIRIRNVFFSSTPRDAST